MPATLKGGLKKAIPLPSGREVRMTFLGITNTAFDAAVTPALEELGRVQKFSTAESANIVKNDRELRNSKAAAAAAVGD
eukprot:1482205-Pyramimonas_sp.AAC.1